MIIMINKLIEKIYNEVKSNNQFPIYNTTYNVLYEVLSLKYLCNKKVLNYDKIMNIDNLESINLNDENLKFKSKVNYKKLLHEIQYENLEEIIKEYITYQNNLCNILSDSNKKLIYLNIYLFDGFYYDLSGNSTYIYKYSHDNTKYLLFKLFDNILKINNEYKKINEIELSKYDELHYVGLIMKDDEIFNKIYNYIENDLKVICYTKYHCISNYRKGRFSLRYLNNVIFLPNNKSILIYAKKNNNEISIINYNDNINFEKLKKIIINNRKTKDILIKVSLTDIRKNNYRLGFRLYQLEYENKNKTINEIVDENTRLIERLERINEVVENEINFLINK